jgi:tetratricopeptide (TPR) repeat protein
MPSASAPIRGRNAVRLWLLVTKIWVFLAAPSSAHETLCNEVALATRAIDQDAQDARLYLHRAELLRLQRRWRAALDDYARAEALLPDLTDVVLGRASLELDAGRPRASLLALETISLGQRTALYWKLKSRAHEMCGELEGARDAQERFLITNSHTRPEDVLRRARLGLAAGESPEVVLWRLETSMVHVGPAPALQRLAIDLELRLGNYEQALARLGTSESSPNRPAAVLVRRAEILELAGRPFEARTVYTEALDQLETLRQERRLAPANDALERRLRVVLSAPFPFPEGHANN